ncbi:MAG: ATPase, T2SS/T4P/T4SS family [Christensenella sp.]
MLNISEHDTAIKASLDYNEYANVLSRVQEHISVSFSDIDNVSSALLKDAISQYIKNNGIRCTGTYCVEELTNYLYHDMAEYSFITRESLFDKPNFEELNINSWDDVDIKIDGRTYKTEYRFISPMHAIDIHKRMLRINKITLDDAKPRAIADIGDNIRICVEKTPIVDKDVAVVSSIRKVKSGFVEKEELIKWGTANEDMINLLLLCLEHGVSVCVSGETGSGKTTLAGALIAIVSQNLRTVTIEEGSREWQFRAKDAHGAWKNSVVHMKTLQNEDEQYCITQGDLVKDALRLDPDFLPIGEIRGEEAYEIMGASNTGHTVITTIHSNGTEDTPLRLITLAKKAFDMSDTTLLSMASRAFPILVHIELCADKKRRITEISEVLSYDGSLVKQNMLYQYDISDNIKNGNEVTVNGCFSAVGKISSKLAGRMLKKGAERSELEKYI